MTIKQNLCIGGLLLLTTAAQAQITITEADIRARFTAAATTVQFYEATTLDGLDDVAAMTGNDLVFDLRDVSFSAGETYTAQLISCGPTLPGCDDPDFATANLVVRESYSDASADSVALSFARLEADGFYVLGAAAEGDFDDTLPGLESFTIKFNPALLIEKLPLTMGTSWTTEAAVEGTEFDETGIAITMEESYVVEGWGTLMTPGGSSGALKVRNESIQRISFLGQTFADTSYSIDFITQTNLGANISLDAEGNVVGAGYSSVVDDLSTDPGSDEVPQDIALEQNYPNPFNPSTTLPFTLRQPGHVRLSIVDLQGREVAVLVDAVRPAGSYSVSWEPVDLPSGVYLVQLRTAETTLARSVILLK